MKIVIFAPLCYWTDDRYIVLKQDNIIFLKYNINITPNLKFSL